jgi:hypothetical protein
MWHSRRFRMAISSLPSAKLGPIQKYPEINPSRIAEVLVSSPARARTLRQFEAEFSCSFEIDDRLELGWLLATVVTDSFHVYQHKLSVA